MASTKIRPKIAAYLATNLIWAANRFFLLFLCMLWTRLTITLCLVASGFLALAQDGHVSASSATDSKVRIERGSHKSEVYQAKGYPKKYDKKNKKAARNVAVNQGSVYKANNKRQQRRNNKMRLNGRDQ
jgi:hypothetical protein